MNHLKHQIWVGLTLSTVVAFAVAGCGKKSSGNDADNSAATLSAASKDLAGTWVSDPQAVGSVQKNTDLLTVTDAKVSLRRYCQFTDTNKTLVTDTANTLVGRNKKLAMAAAKNNSTKDDKDATRLCYAYLAAGEYTYKIDKDDLTFTAPVDTADPAAKPATTKTAVEASDAAKTPANVKTIVFHRKTADQVTQLDASLRAGTVVVDPKAPATPAKTDAATTPATPPSITGKWILKADVPEVKTKSNGQVTMTRYDLITFDTATMTFTEGVVCQYALTAQATTPAGVANTLDAQTVAIKKPIAYTESKPGSTSDSITITTSTANPGSAPYVAPGLLSNSDTVTPLLNCKLGYDANAVYTVARPSSSELDLTDKDGNTRKFQAFDPKNTDQASWLDIINSTKASSKTAAAASAPATGAAAPATGAAAPSAGSSTGTAAPATGAAAAPATGSTGAATGAAAPATSSATGTAAPAKAATGAAPAAAAAPKAADTKLTVDAGKAAAAAANAASSTDED